MSRPYLSAAAAALLSGCAALVPEQPPAPVATIIRSDADLVLELLLRLDRLAGQPAEAQHQEVLAAQAEFERNPGDGLVRLRLALALSLPRVGNRDEARVIALLADWPATGEPSLRREVVMLVHRLTLERQRLLKEEVRRYEGLREEHRRTEAALRENQRKLEELQQKLGALRAIDRDSRRQPRR